MVNGTKPLNEFSFTIILTGKQLQSESCAPHQQKGVFHTWIAIIQIESDVAEYEK